MKLRSLIAAGTALAAIAAPAANAATDTTTVTVSGDGVNGLTFSGTPAFSNFAGVTLGTATQTANADAAAFAVQDTRGGLSGWRVTIAASQFEKSDDSTVKLPAGSLTVAALPDIAPQTALSPLINALTKPLLNNSLIGQPIDDGTAKNYVVSAANLAALGQWNVAEKTGALQVSVPPTTQAGTYTSTVTTTLVSGIS
jgi:hypothetical protein